MKKITIELPREGSSLTTCGFILIAAPEQVSPASFVEQAWNEGQFGPLFDGRDSCADSKNDECSRCFCLARESSSFVGIPEYTLRSDTDAIYIYHHMLSTIGNFPDTISNIYASIGKIKPDFKISKTIVGYYNTFRIHGNTNDIVFSNIFKKNGFVPSECIAPSLKFETESSYYDAYHEQDTSLIETQFRAKAFIFKDEKYEEPSFEFTIDTLFSRKLKKDIEIGKINSKKHISTFVEDMKQRQRNIINRTIKSNFANDLKMRAVDHE